MTDKLLRDGGKKRGMNTLTHQENTPETRITITSNE